MTAIETSRNGVTPGATQSVTPMMSAFRAFHLDLSK